MTTQVNSRPALSRTPVVIVLASGRGERFIAAGGTGSKLQALLAGRPVLERTLDAVRASGLPWHVEDAGHPGMGDSIAAAVRATSGAAGWLILPGDLPLVQPATLRAVAAALGGRVNAVQPQFQGERGHPVGFAAGCGAQLATLEGNLGASPVLRAMRAIDSVADLAVDDAGVVTDIDTPEALARAEALWLARAAA
ncbi:MULTISPECIES: NTP transferase domain-containing protein [unclassified Variovorax]|jgi:molybdenum cofactor cytidylyltransferase|uniref:nucleotidyltransferase family protein n=1 Tax=unclassified Variovorax TaxID=663243 RepID=UPI0008D11E74|nr:MULTISPECIES: NTP transferase domain-containing protein [unclassified Variovorax]SEJ54368.1 molybdenum cofactor cytidylyltransferase [Variovorax sp. OK202]SFC58331.1 molybdenum cofactor cytidylyltransferase [Variovorax sp. OK212]